MKDLKQMYKTILGDQFPLELRISFGDQALIYRKRTWKIKNSTQPENWKKKVSVMEKTRTRKQHFTSS